MKPRFDIWFYIGAVLLLYGVLLTAAGVYQWTHPPRTVLANMHAVLWAGLALLAVGLTYVGAFWPRRRDKGRM